MRISDMYLNFFVHDGRGSASDYRILMDRVLDKVESTHGIRLQPEVKVIGEDKDPGEAPS